MKAFNEPGSIGESPALLLVHGVGPGPETFGEVARLLGSTHRVLVVRRLGYQSADPPSSCSLDDQLDEIWDQARSLGAGPYQWVGVSGGATLGVLAALRHAGLMAGLFAHEPLFGPLAPALHQQVAVRAQQLLVDRRPEAAMEFVEELMGESWGRLPATTVDRIRARSGVIRAEVPHFLAFAPEVSALAALRLPVTISVGERSARVRHDAVTIGARALGAHVSIVRGAGHLPQVDDPAGFAELVRSTLTSPRPRRVDRSHA